MPRSILLVDAYYFSLLRDHGLEQRPEPGDSYDAALGRALDIGFSTSNTYQRNLTELGWKADVIIPNSLTLQSLWAREHGSRAPWTFGWAYGPHAARLPLAGSLLHRVPHLHSVLLEQVRRLKPDVVFIQDINYLPPGLSKLIRRHTGLLVGEIASPLPPKSFLLAYDLIVSALPSIVDTVRKWGVASEGIPLAFDEQWTTMSPASSRPIDAIFVGSFTRLQPQTIPLLQAVAAVVPGLRIYGPADPAMLAKTGLAERHGGPAWGRDMFDLLGSSKMVINRHGSIAGEYAVNMRMYEATGSGAALITEQKSNLAQLFTPGDEVIAYRGIEDAAAQAAALLADPERLDRVAAAGQARTLAEHSYRHRAEQLAAALESGLRARGR